MGWDLQSEMWPFISKYGKTGDEVSSGDNQMQFANNSIREWDDKRGMEKVNLNKLEKWCAEYEVPFDGRIKKGN